MVQGIRLAEGFHSHTPNEVTAFSMTFANGLFGAEEVDSVITTTVISDGLPGLDIIATNVESPFVNVGVDDGVVGNVYFVVVRVLTTFGQELEGAVKVIVGQAAP